ncbi:hypothetical protein Rs2_29352 [Raphanus sativus]|nr:hypothetical protein Rs2_29352 [Raphanus sativus]
MCLIPHRRGGHTSPYPSHISAASRNHRRKRTRRRFTASHQKWSPTSTPFNTITSFHGQLHWPIEISSGKHQLTHHALLTDLHPAESFISTSSRSHLTCRRLNKAVVPVTNRILEKQKPPAKRSFRKPSLSETKASGHRQRRRHGPRNKADLIHQTMVQDRNSKTQNMQISIKRKAERKKEENIKSGPMEAVEAHSAGVTIHGGCFS